MVAPPYSASHHHTTTTTLFSTDALCQGWSLWFWVSSRLYPPWVDPQVPGGEEGSTGWQCVGSQEVSSHVSKQAAVVVVIEAGIVV